MIISVKGAEIHCASRGDGPVCLVLSSIGTKPYELQVPERLSEDLRLVFVDLRGSGRSTGDPSGLTFDVLAQDLEAVRGALGVEHVAVLGHSILGALAIEYARRCPGSVSHVIAVGTPPSGDMLALAARAAAFFNADASEERKRQLQLNVSRLPAGAPPSQMALAQTPQRFFDFRFDPAPLFAEAQINLAFFTHLMGKLVSAWDVLDGADALSVPLLLALGRFDYTVPHVLWKGVLERLPQATLELFEQSGHQPFFEEPERFSEVLLGWMRRQGEGHGR